MAPSFDTLTEQDLHEEEEEEVDFSGACERILSGCCPSRLSLILFVGLRRRLSRSQGTV